MATNCLCRGSKLYIPSSKDLLDSWIVNSNWFLVSSFEHHWIEMTNCKGSKFDLLKIIFWTSFTYQGWTSITRFRIENILSYHLLKHQSLYLLLYYLCLCVLLKIDEFIIPLYRIWNVVMIVDYYWMSIYKT